MDGFRVEPEQLRDAANGISTAIGAADDTNLEDIPGRGEAYGHDKVSAALKSFCTTWELAKQLLQQRSASAGSALVDDAGVYEEQEARGVATFDPAYPQPTPTPGPVPTPATLPVPQVATPQPTPQPMPQPTPLPAPQGAP